jgi:hypothetical protein
MLMAGQVSPAFAEDVLCDAAARGLVRAIVDGQRQDRLPAAVARETDTLRGIRRPAPPPAEIPIHGLATDAAADEAGAGELLGEKKTRREEEGLEDAAQVDAPLETSGAPAELSGYPAVVAAAIDRTPRSGAPLAEVEPVAPPGPLMSLGSLSPPPVENQGIEASASFPIPRPKTPAARAARARSAEAKASPTPQPAVQRSEEPRSATPRPDDDSAALLKRLRKPQIPPFAPPLPEPAAPAKSDASHTNRAGMWTLFAAAGIVFAVGARMSRDRSLSEPTALPPPPPVQTIVLAPAPQPPPAVETAALAPAPTPTPSAAPSTEPAAVQGLPEGESAHNPVLPQDLPLRLEDRVPRGQGMLEVVAGVSDVIFVNGQLVGNGPKVKLPLAPKPEAYEVRVKLRGEERVRFALVKEGRLTRLRVAPPWSR